MKYFKIQATNKEPVVDFDLQLRNFILFELKMGIEVIVTSKKQLRFRKHTHTHTSTYTYVFHSVTLPLPFCFQ